METDVQTQENIQESSFEKQFIRTGNLLTTMTNFRGVSLAIFGAIIAIGGQIMGSGLTIVIGVVLLIPGILDYTMESVSGLVNSTDILLGVGALLGGLILVIKTSYIANFFLLLGFGMVIYGIRNKSIQPSPTKVEYKFVPRTFKEDQENPVKVSDVFSDMFTKPAPFPVSGYASQNSESTGRRTIEYITSPFS